ncbi:MAG TPA: SLBB domain-containing protein [Ignavibacteria bacterium]
MFKIIKIFVFVFFLIISSLTAQDQKTTNTSSNLKINSDGLDILSNLQNQNPYNSANFKLIALEGAINSDTYLVGPNDQFEVGLYGYINQQLPLVVSPEGYLVIPTIGQIKASGYTITELRNNVTSAVKKRYYSSDVSLTLTVPRTFLITVSGLKQGTYEASPVMRVSSLVHYVLMLDSSNLIYNLQTKLDTRPEKFFDSSPSLRNIELKRKNGSVVKVDLYKFYMTKEDKYNPFLSEGDFLKIPYNLIAKTFISIDGAVQLPGTYEYSEGDDLETAIGLGRGFEANAEQDSIILFRPYGDSKGFDLVNLSYPADKNYQINNFDRIFVKNKTDYQKNISVLVLGEVQRPGYYPISFKNTRLKDVIDMAGGFRENAYLPLCILFRKYDEEYTRRDSTEIMINMRANDVLITPVEKRNFETDIFSRRNRVVVDFEKLIINNDQSQNALLEDKDIIYINDDKKIVYVYGQVNNEGYVPFVAGKEYEYYIEKAGGYSLSADDGNTRIIKFNSRGWYKPEDTGINSGDYIYVPKYEKKTFTEKISLIAQIAGVILGVLTTYLLFKK